MERCVPRYWTPEVIATLIRLATVKRLGFVVNKSKCLPHLTAANAEPLQVLGMVSLDVHIGDQEVYNRWCVVVPDRYLSKDLLLGCDVIRRSTLTWDPKKEILVWGKTEYQVNQIKVTPKTIRKVQTNQEIPQHPPPIPKFPPTPKALSCREMI